MGKARRSPSSWRYQVMKGYKHRAQKFQERADTIEEMLAWTKVIEWFDSIISRKRLKENGSLGLDQIPLEEILNDSP